MYIISEVSQVPLLFHAENVHTAHAYNDLYPTVEECTNLVALLLHIYCILLIFFIAAGATLTTLGL